MISTAIRYALEQVEVPSGPSLWLCGEPEVPHADAYQPRQDRAQALLGKGHKVFSDWEKIGRDYASVFLHCPKQRDESEGLMALAFDRSQGFVMAVAENDAGGTRLRKMMEAYNVPVFSEGKSHCRIVWTLAAPQADRAVIDQNLSQLAPRQVEMEGEAWWSIPGLFSWDRVDPGSQLLLQHLPPNLGGRIADFGCGYGYLSAKVANLYPSVKQIDAYDIDARAVFCCAKNNGDKVKAVWQDIASLKANPIYNTVIMNPPFHTGKEVDIELGQAFIQKAGECVKPGGRLFLVANRRLAYEHVVPGLESLHESGGYKILTATASS